MVINFIPGVYTDNMKCYRGLNELSQLLEHIHLMFITYSYYIYNMYFLQGRFKCVYFGEKTIIFNTGTQVTLIAWR